ncbi:MAG: hypothetical protein Q8P67_16000 [archaeon]|nr:hypothetical protein [archaeon]
MAGQQEVASIRSDFLRIEAAALRLEIENIRRNLALVSEVASIRQEFDAIQAAARGISSGSAPGPSSSSSPSSSPVATENQRLATEKLSEAKANTPSLTELNFCHFRDSPADFQQQLYDALVNNSHVKTLELASCGLSNEGVKKLSELLLVNPNITALNLESNHITAPGIQSLCEVLTKTSTLAELRLANQAQTSGNPSEMALAEALKVNKSLTKFTLHVHNGGARTTIDGCLTRNREEARVKRIQASR